MPLNDHPQERSQTLQLLYQCRVQCEQIAVFQQRQALLACLDAIIQAIEAKRYAR